MSSSFSCFSFVQELLLILRCGVACFADSLFRRSFFPYLLGKPCFFPGYVRFQLSACVRRRKRRRVFSGYARAEGFSLAWCVRVRSRLLPIWYYGMELTPLSFILLLLSACSMVRGQEETSTSQAGCRRGPSWDTPSTRSIISSLSMEELRTYCRIPGNIDFKLLDGLTESTINKEDDTIYFTSE